MRPKLVVIDLYSANELVLARCTCAFKVVFVLTATALLGTAINIQLALQTTAWVA